MKLAIIGYGGVGKALVRLLNQKKEYLKKEGMEVQVNYILDYYGGIYQKEGIDLEELIEFTKTEKDITKYKERGHQNINFDMAMKNNDFDMIVVMTPTNKETGEPGLSYIKKALSAGKQVVTSDKGPILLEYKQLNQLAKENKVQLAIGCTSGGALPTINGGLFDMAGADITTIEGVLNGTTNFVLKEMEEKKITYEEALKTAQDLGIAETNPSLDVEGWDTASKLLILTNVLMNQTKTLADIKVEGITKLTQEQIAQAKQEGKKYKLIGRTTNKNNTLEMTVQPEKLNKDHTLYGVDDKNKAVRYTTETLGDLTIIGGASGVTPAAASILRDMINIARGYQFSK